ncbi:hypothetical protein LP417_02030 [Polaromonas sp. P1-6]|nr:hypothetical protein LP417_02030 [Polaromonas sp. P1-6]UUZ70646.1 hypothetical protein LP416_02830 [Polaromonas sp. P2-4]
MACKHADHILIIDDDAGLREKLHADLAAMQALVGESLAIAQQLAQVLRGELTLARREGGGLQARLCLPRSYAWKVPLAQ